MAKLLGTTYTELSELTKRTSSRKIGNNTTVRNLGMNNELVIELHGNQIVQLDKNGDMYFSMAGHDTVTTRERINQFLPLEHRVFQKDWQQFYQAPDKDPVKIDLWSWNAVLVDPRKPLRARRVL